MGSFSTSITNANGHLDASYPRNVICYYTTKQNIENNTTTFEWEIKTGIGNNPNVWTVFSNVQLYVNGNSVFYDGGGHYQHKSNEWIGNGTLTIPHNADGTKTISVSLEAGIYVWAVNSTYSGSIELPRIPKQADLTAADNFNDEQNPTIKYSNRAGNAVDKLQATIKWNGGSLLWRDVSKTAGSYTFSLTDEERIKIRKAMSKLNSMPITYSLYTKVGSKEYYSNLDKTVSIINAAPSVIVSGKDINQKTLGLTGDKNKVVFGASNIQIDASPILKKEASSATVSITSGDTTLSGKSVVFNKATSNIFNVLVKDSRGNIKKSKYILKGINYIPLTCSITTSVKLVGETKATIHIEVEGKYFSGSFGKVNNSLQLEYGYKLKNSQQIMVYYPLQYRVSSNGYTASADIENIDYRDDYIIQAYAKDALNEVYTQEKTVSAKPIFYWSKDEFNINGTFNVNGSIMQNGQEFGGGSGMLDKVYPIGSIYLSVNSTNPNTLFGFGTWERLEDKFLVGAGASYSGGATGGAANHTHKTKGHTLTTAEIPSHSHDGIYNKENGTWYYNYYTSAAANKGYDIGAMTSGNTGYIFSTGNAGGGGSHTHGDTESASSLPPYLAVYMWQRTG